MDDRRPWAARPFQLRRGQTLTCQACRATLSQLLYGWVKLSLIDRGLPL